MDFVKSNYSLKELEKLRDENGFIDLSIIGLEFTPESREKKGTEERLKNWVDFNGKKALIRGEAVKNYSVYAELIVEEIANQLGIETAHYDLVKIKDNTGKNVYATLSESIIDFDKEELITLHDLIGDEPEYETEDIMEAIEYEETTRYTFTVDKLRERFTKAGYSKEAIENIITDYNKRLVFYLSILDTDKHSENIAFVKNKNTGKVQLSPNYDSEFSLLLERDPEIVEFFLEDNIQLKEEVNIAYPKIGIYVSKENGGLDSIWKDTLEMLCEDDEVYDYYINTIKNGVDMNVALENVLNGEDLELNTKSDPLDFDPYQLLCHLINQGKIQQLKTGEQMQIDRNMEKDMIAAQINILETGKNNDLNEK